MSEEHQHAGHVGSEPVHGDKSSAVSDVIASVQGLDAIPVEEHVAVYEQAHERLRRALDQQHG